MSIAVTGIQAETADLIRLRVAARGIKLRPRKRVAAPLAGLHQSPLRGRGVDFLESRVYQPGDDIRHMDWRVTARSGTPHSKIFQEEREWQVLLVFDCNPSMFFGTRRMFKSVLAARLAAILGWAVVENNDRIGALFFGHRGYHELEPTGGRKGALALIRNLVQWTEFTTRPSAATISPLSDALHRLRRVARPGSLIYLISDFYSLDERALDPLSKLRQHCDIIACQINDPLEISPPDPGRYLVSDGDAIRLLDTRSEAGLEHYQRHFAEHHSQVHGTMRTHGIPLLQFTTDGDLLDDLRRGKRPMR